MAQDFCVGDLDHNGTVGVDDTILFLEDLPRNDYSYLQNFNCTCKFLQNMCLVKYHSRTAINH